MTRLAAIGFGWLFTAACALAQPGGDETQAGVERARLSRERARIEAEYQSQERACYARFAVSDCVGKANARRRQGLADLRRQEVALNDMERKRKAMERHRAVQEREEEKERATAAKPAPSASEAGALPDNGRAIRVNERSTAARAAHDEKDVQRRLAEAQSAREKREQDAADRRRQSQERAEKAREREEKLRKRMAGRKKPPASSLQDPPA